MLSIVYAVASIYLLLLVVVWVTENIHAVRSVVYELVSIFGKGFIMITTGILLFIVYFLALQWRMFSYFDQINDIVRQMANGQLDFNYKIPVRKKSLFGDLAVNVNSLAGRLTIALEEERLAEQTKNELITNVSHDLRTPLTSVLGYLGLIEQDRYRDEVELRHYVQIAYDKSQRLNVLINDLFEYTRMRHDTVQLKESHFNVIEMLGQLLVQYHMPLQEAGMHSKLITNNAAATIKGDPAKLVRVFENLIANAMLYGREGKLIELSVQLVGHTVVVDVINFGDPIPAIDLPHIFDRFYRVDKSRTQWSGGSGLGLAISKSIVEKHGGTITVTSDSDQTAFRVTLPIVK